MNGKEALKKIRKATTERHRTFTIESQFEEQFDIIEKDLDELEQLRLIFPLLNKDAIKEQEKRNEVLEIIKKKRVDLDLFLRVMSFNNVELYNFEMNNGARNLTETEFNLIKSALEY